MTASIPPRRRHGFPLVIALAAAVAVGPLAVAPATAQVKLPDFGDSSGGALSAADDRKLGEAFMRAVRAEVEIVEDPEVAGYVQSLGQRLAGHGESLGTRLHFFTVAENSINAFAGPGGYIGIHTGLILASEFEGELAAVVAHEIAHVTQRHIARAFELADRSKLPTLAAMVAAVLVGTQNSQAGQAAAAAIVGAQIQTRLNFTRANELEADRVGMALLNGAGFDPRAMPAMFEKLQTAGRYYRTPPEFLSTHPVTTSRIGDTRNRAEQYPYRQHANSDAYLMVKAKLRVLTAKDPQAVVEAFERELEDGRYRNVEATAYGWALGLTQVRRFDESREVLERLVEQYPQRVAFRVALGRNALAANAVREALDVFARAYRLYPDNRALVLGFAQARLQAGRPREALELLEDHARVSGMTGQLYKVLAEAHRQAGNEVASLLALAEHSYLRGELELALHQLRTANRREVSDYYLGARVAARLRELEAEHEAGQGKRRR